MSDLLSAFTKLQVSEEKCESLDHLITLLHDLQEDRDEQCAQIHTDDVLPLLHEMLVQPTEYRTKVAHITAELAKAESLREKFVNYNFIPPLVKLLSDSDVPLATQACRALGNICYENDVAREAVDAADGVQNLLQLLRTQTQGRDEETKRLRIIACGFLLNLSNSNDSIQTKAMGGGAVDILCDYLKCHIDDNELCHMVLPTFTSLLDSGVGQDDTSSIKVTSSLLRLLDSQNGTIFEECSLDLLMLLSENDDVKEMVAVSELPARLVQVISENMQTTKQEEDDDDKEELVALASDLIVALLRGDKSMHILYDKGDGLIFKESLKWLDSNNDHLEIAGSLSIGNFARNDEHCLKLVEKRVLPQLLALLEDPNKSNITLQHACLSALRNLAIPMANKPVLVASGVLSVVLKLAAIEVLPVVFKLLGVVRMLIDGQKEAALYVASNTFFMKQLFDWCTVEEHAGVKGESTRLIAWLIKNCNATSVNSSVVKAEAVNHLVAMVTSEHVVMQTESLLALTLMCHSVLDEAASQLKEADVVLSLCTVLKNESTQPEVLCNALALTAALDEHTVAATPVTIQCSLLACGRLATTNSKSIHEEMLEVGIDDIVEKLKSHDDSGVRQSATDVFRKLTISGNVSS